MTREMGITVGDLREKIKGLPDETEIYITHCEWDSNYCVDTIASVGITGKCEDDDDRKDGCPVGLEFISNDQLEQSDIYTAFQGLAGYEQKDLIFHIIQEDDDLLRMILETYGGSRW